MCELREVAEGGVYYYEGNAKEVSGYADWGRQWRAGGPRNIGRSGAPWAVAGWGLRARVPEVAAAAVGGPRWGEGCEGRT